MKIIIQTPKKSLNKAFLKQRPLRSEIELFKNNLIQLLGNIDVIEREENQKNHISNFLRDTYYKNINEVNTKDNIDLVIHLGKTNKDNVGVIIETKRPSNINEMLSQLKPNSKALQELVLYYLRERIDGKNIDIKYCVATNIYEWYLFESKYFEKLFYDNKNFVKQYEDWRDGKKVTKDTNLFYNDIAKPFIDSIEDEIPCTYFDIRDYENIIKNDDKEDDKNLIALFKILSPFHLLKVPFADDSNKLDEKFYKELLYIIGLEEVKEGSKHIIRRKENGERNSGSLIENAINVLETEYSINKVSDSERFGNTKEERYFNTALELCITWINRVLFLKLLEGQLINYHKGNKDYKFLNSKTVNDYDELYRLFHQVLAKQDKDRIDLIRNKYKNVPYLNSSLFEISELEDQTIKINSFDNSATLDLINTTILKEVKNKTDKLPTLEYLFKFLNAYDFASEGTEDILDENKTLINSSVLGKVFEKINGYKDGSIFTPGFITMYMCRQTIRLAVVQKFKDKYNWNIEKFEDLQNYIADRKSSNDILEFNELVNSLRLCDPAVGSGHYLVSSLNEIIVIKYELGIFADEYGRRLTDYEIEVEQDELIITDKHGDIFEYTIENGKPSNKESQRLQKTLFHEKQTIIENCLFGVDINQNSVKICRLRLWIELLKNAYYKEETDFKELETLPNIDINIKCGNSLISRFPLDANLSKFGQKEKNIIEDYRNSVREYKNERNRDKKKDLEEIIQQLKNDIRTDINKKDPKLVKLNNLKGELDNLTNQSGLFELSKKELKDQSIKKKKFETDLTKLTKAVEDIKSNAIYKNAFEWRIEFPEVLDNIGNFVGFDIVISNPPYVKIQELKHNLIDWYKDNKKVAHKRIDISILFFELSKDILRENGIANLISSNQFIVSEYGRKLREFLLKDFAIDLIIDFGDLPIFEGSLTYVSIFQLSNKKSTDFRYIKISEIEEAKNLIVKNANKIEISKLTYDNWVLTSNKNTIVINKICLNEPLSRIGKCSYGIVSGSDNIFIVNDKVIEEEHLERDSLLPIIRAENCNRYSYTDFQLQVIYPYKMKNGLTVLLSEDELKESFPNTFKYLLKNEIKLRERKDSRKTFKNSNKWYSLTRFGKLENFRCKKIVFPGEQKHPKFAIDLNNSGYSGARVFGITLTSENINMNYILALLNSKVIEFIIKSSFPLKQGGYYSMSSTFVDKLPIILIEHQKQKPIIKIVDEIFELKKYGKDTTALEGEIDRMVYKLYDLTEEEIKLVEGNN